MVDDTLQRRRDRALGAGAELFYDTPLEIVRGEGAYLFDREGRRYVDLYNNVPCVGHGNPAVVQAMAEQQATLNVHSRYLHEGIVAFAERLTGLNHDGIESVVFSCSGTEANDVAIQIARLVTGKRGLICTNSAYHGNSETVDAMSYIGLPAEQLGDVRSFPFPELYRPLVEGMSEAELTAAYVASVEQAIASHEAEGHGFAGLIVCSIFANEGVPALPAGVMAAITDCVHRAGGVIIADEVQSGYGRTGCWWGYQATQFVPDIVVTGKPMGNGLPIAATMTRTDWIERFRAEKDYFNTTAATPLQAAVGMAVLDEIERLDLVNHAGSVGATLIAALQERVPMYNVIGDARGFGLFISVEMVVDKVTREPDRSLALALCERLKDKGFLVSYSGQYENVVKIRPPLVFSNADADEFLAAFDASLGELTGQS